MIETIAHGLAVSGLVARAIMAVGLVSVPGIVRGTDAQAAAPWYVNAGYAGGLGWMLSILRGLPAA